MEQPRTATSSTKQLIETQEQKTQNRNTK